MKQPLQNVDKLSVQYALGDLDPAEARLFERRLQDDQDLLIETGSLQATWKRVEGLPRYDAPPALLAAIRAEAAAVRQAGRAPARVYRMGAAWRWVAAASLAGAVGLTTWSLWPTAGSPAVGAGSSAAGATLVAPGTDSLPAAEPWVDRQEVIRLGQTAAVENPTDTAGKLIPLPENASRAILPSKPVQLAGAPQNR